MKFISLRKTAEDIDDVDPAQADFPRKQRSLLDEPSFVRCICVLEHSKMVSDYGDGKLGMERVALIHGHEISDRTSPDDAVTENNEFLAVILDQYWNIIPPFNGELQIDYAIVWVPSDMIGDDGRIKGEMIGLMEILDRQSAINTWDEIQRRGRKEGNPWK